MSTPAAPAPAPAPAEGLVASESPLAPTPTGRQTVLVAVSQAVLMGFGALLALLIAQAFGKTTETDAFFAAYGLYSVGQVFGQSFRLTAVPRLVRAPDARTAGQLIAATVLIAVAAGLPMVLLAGPVGHALVATDPTHATPTALRILWVALAGQLVAAMLSTMLAVRGAFTALALVTFTTGFVSTAVFVACRAPLGIHAASTGLAGGAVYLTVASVLVLRRRGWPIAPPSWRALGAAASDAGRLMFASTTFVGSTLAYVVSIAFASRQGGGQATLFSYAFVLGSVLVTLTANVTAIVRSPSLVGSADRAARALATGASSFRFTLVIGGPALALIALVGPPLIELALGSGFSGTDVRAIVVDLGCLSGFVLGSAAGVFAIVELLARGELTRLAVVAAGQVALTAAVVATGAAVAGTPGVAAGLSLVTMAVALVQMRLAFGELARAAVREMARATARETVVVGLASAPGAAVLLALGTRPAGYVAAGVISAVAMLAATRWAWPDEAALFAGLLRRSHAQPVAAP